MTHTVVAGDPEPEEWADQLYRNLRQVKAHMDGLVEGLRKEGLLLGGDSPPPATPDRTAPALIVLRPGDKVLVALVEDPTEADARTLANTLRGSFPGVDFTVVGGIAGLCMQS